ncbi:MAG TPA: hypothetical protein VFI45_12385 [Candidatus Acidoferrum sp.]|nr:hypothetical protein [Candidatus Acidoferrum sp.]
MTGEVAGGRGVGVTCGFEELDNFSAARCTVGIVKVFGGALLLFFAGVFAASGRNTTATSLPLDEPTGKASSAKAPVIVVGFVGGFVRHDNAVHSPVQLASRIHDGYPSGVHVEVFENRRREQAYQEILKLLDADQDGKLSEEEKRSARIIIYGMSWGGSETVALARELGEQKIPVLLTIQVDSVAKVGQDDAVIPANVAEAANYYQAEGLLHGQTAVRAADAKSTRILGNFRFSYGAKTLKCENYPWYDRVFMKYHTEIECDPAVWKQVEALIRAKLPPVATQRAEAGNVTASAGAK